MIERDSVYVKGIVLERKRNILEQKIVENKVQIVSFEKTVNKIEFSFKTALKTLNVILTLKETSNKNKIAVLLQLRLSQIPYLGNAKTRKATLLKKLTPGWGSFS